MILHEMAHAWNHHDLTDEVRSEFMAFRGLTQWNDKDIPWKDRGIEALAEAVTWGLYDDPVGNDDRRHTFALITGLSR